MAIIRGDTLKFLPQIFTFEVWYFAGVLNVVLPHFNIGFYTGVLSPSEV